MSYGLSGVMDNIEGVIKSNLACIKQLKAANFD